MNRMLLCFSALAMFAAGGELEETRAKRDAALQKVEADYQLKISQLKVKLTQAGETGKAKALDSDRPPPEANEAVETRKAGQKKIQGIYVAELGKLKSKAQQAGDLDAVTKVEKELDAVKEPSRDLGQSALGKLGDSRQVGKGLNDAKAGSGALGAVTRKTAIEGRVLQVWDDALLFTGSKNAVFILVGHPDQRTIADGNSVNCYAIETEEVRKYTNTKGVERTARVYRYHSRRIGK